MHRINQLTCVVLLVLFSDGVGLYMVLGNLVWDNVELFCSFIDVTV